MTLYDASRRRLVRRDRAAEQRAVERLHELGFRQSWNFALSRHDLAVGVEQFPRAVRTLVNEGWRVEAEGKLIRAARHSSARAVGDRLVRARRPGRLRRRPARRCPTCSPPSAAARRWSRSATARWACSPRTGSRSTARSPTSARRTGDHVRFGAAQAGAARRAARRAAGGHRRRGVRTGARRALRTFEGVEPLEPPEAFHGELRPYQREGLGWLDFLRRFGFGGCLADDMGLGKTVQVLALLAAPAAPRQRRRPSPSAGGRAAVARLQLDRRRPRGSRRASACSTTPAPAAHARRDDFAEYDLIVTTYGTLRTRRRRAAQGCRVRLRDPRRGAGDQERRRAGSAKAARLLQARPPPGAERHADREPPRRALDPLRVPQPRHARHRRRSSSGTPAGARPAPTSRPRDCWPQALRPFILRRTKEQVAQGPAREDRADPLLRPGAAAAQALRRAARPLPHGAARARTTRRLGPVEDRRSSRRCCGSARPPATPA